MIEEKMETELLDADLDNIAGGGDPDANNNIDYYYSIDKDKDGKTIYLVQGEYQNSGEVIPTRAIYPDDFEKFRWKKESEGDTFYQGIMNPVEI